MVSQIKLSATEIVSALLQCALFRGVPGHCQRYAAVICIRYHEKHIIQYATLFILKNAIKCMTENITEHNISQGDWTIKAEVAKVTYAVQVLCAQHLWLKVSHLDSHVRQQFQSFLLTKNKKYTVCKPSPPKPNPMSVKL